MPHSSTATFDALPTALGAATLCAVDPAPLERFYGDVLGLATTFDDERRTTLRSADGTALLHVERAPDGAPRWRPDQPGLFHVALRFASRAALAAALRRVLEAGQRLDGASDHGVSEALYLRDPEGNGVELYWDRPIDDWPRERGELTMFSAALDLESLLRDAARDDGALPPHADLGHVHLQVSDVERSAAFQRDLLGLDLHQRFGPQAAFLAVGPYHHHIGLNSWSSRRRPSPPPGATGLARFELRLPEDRHAAALDRLRAAGAPLLEDGADVVTHDPDGIEIALLPSS